MIGKVLSINRIRINIDGPGVTTLVGMYKCPLNCEYCNENDFSQRLKYALDKNDMKQSVLSRKTGIDKSYICKYLSGAFIPKYDKIVLMAKALNVSGSWLAGYDMEIVSAEASFAPRDRLDQLMLSMFNKLSLAHQEEIIKYITNLSLKEN